jgi:hypothetical protein
MTQELLDDEATAAETVTELDSELDSELDPEFDSEIVTELDISHLVIEDDTPVDNFQSELQQRLLVEPLYSSEALPAPFLAAANVGVFYKIKGDPIVPDMFLSLEVQRAEDFSQRQNRSYFVWEFGKVPEVCVEVVSNQEGDELQLSAKSRQKGKLLSKKQIYAQIGVRYYVVFDPLQRIQDDMNGALLRVWSISPDDYIELTPAQGISAVGQTVWLNSIGIGLTLWEGQFEEKIPRLWLRWCGQDSQVIATGAERADSAEARADNAEARADNAEARAEQLAARLRAMGIDPDE